ncbi:hypothetical protein Tco_0609185 [Tanacetum coccineum]
MTLIYLNTPALFLQLVDEHTVEDDLEVFSINDVGLDWISAYNFLTCLQKLSSYASGHLEVSELAACLEKASFSSTSGHVEEFTTASLEENTIKVTSKASIKDAIEATIEAIAEAVILPVLLEPTFVERIDEIKEEIRAMRVRVVATEQQCASVQARARAAEQRDEYEVASVADELSKWDNRNENGNENGNVNGNGNRNENRNEAHGNTRGVVSAVRECTYKEFLNCQPLMCCRVGSII